MMNQKGKAQLLLKTF